MKYYLVPETDIRKLEQERKILCKWTEDKELVSVLPVFSLTSTAWRITHRKYKWLFWWRAHN